MPEDIRETFSEKRAEIELILETARLTEEERNKLRTAMEFGYAAAFCERTCDMSEAFGSANYFEDIYKRIRRELE